MSSPDLQMGDLVQIVGGICSRLHLAHGTASPDQPALATDRRLLTAFLVHQLHFNYTEAVS